MRQRVLVTTSSEDTESVGAEIGARLGPGDVIDLRGELGAGKTQFVRGLARGLGIAQGVRSPTYTICQLHAGRVPLLHVDAYRLEDSRELLLHGWDDLAARAVVAVEWGDRLGPLLPERRLQVSVAHSGESQRTLRFEAFGGFEFAGGAGDGSSWWGPAEEPRGS